MNGQKLLSLTNDQLHNSVIDIISEIKLITGVIVYEADDNGMMQKQVEMIKRFIVTGFSNLTKEEIVQAFYMNLQGCFDDVYVHYNKELNAEFIGNVLMGYLRYKKRIIINNGHQIDRLLNPPKTEPYHIDYDFWKELIQAEYAIYRQTNSTNQIWMNRKYYTLRKFGLLPFKGIETWAFFIKKALKYTNVAFIIPSKIDFSKFKITHPKQVIDILKNKEDYRIIVDVARQHAYWYILNSCDYCGINNLWDDIEPVKV